MMKYLTMLILLLWTAASGLSAVEVPDLTKGHKPGESADMNLGPTGARGWVHAHELATDSARQILITAVEPKSPAHGILAPNDVILGINETPFTEDARKALAAAIQIAETREGKGRLSLLRWRDGQTGIVVIQLPVIGNYSKSAPYDCGKAQHILDQAAAYILANGMRDGIAGCVNALGLLATGENKYIPTVKDFVMKLNIEQKGMPTWHLGYINILLAEYYLATGDTDILPKIQSVSKTIAEGQSRMGTFGHGFANPETGVLAGYGAVNQCALSAMISLALARKCGLESDAGNGAIERAATFFRYYVDKGSIPYGDHDPYLDTHDNNGVCSSAAVFFDLIGEPEPAQFFSRMATASYGIRESGHTGHFWSHLWAAPGVNRAGQEATSAFLNELWWYFDLERRWDGGFEYQAAPGSKGDSTKGWDTTGARLLMYALPRKKLYLTGRNMQPLQPLTGTTLDATIEAGRGVNWGNRKTIYHDKTHSELIHLIGNWSPIVRTRAAMSLAKLPGNATDEILEIFATGDKYQKLGCLTALQHQGSRAAAAVPLLTGLLTDTDSSMRIAALHALKGIGKAARPAAPEMLRVAQLTFSDDPRNLTRRNIASVLFNDALLDMQTVDRDNLYAAVKDLIRVDDGRARSSVAWLYKQMPFEELKPILPDILWAVKNPSPSGIMFAAGIRDAGLKLLSDNKRPEAIPLLVQYAWDQQQWGSQKRMVKIMSMLEGYGTHAQRFLPELKELVEFCRTEPDFPEWARVEKRKAVEAAIKRIEATTETPELAH